MTLDQLYATLPTTGPVTVDNTLLGRTDIDGFINTYLGRSNILYTALNKTRSPNPAGRDQIVQDLVLPATVTDSFLNLTLNLGRIIYFQTENGIDFALTVNLNRQQGNVQVGWLFSTSYPYLQGSGVEALPAANQSLSLATTLAGEHLPEGLSYSGDLAMTGPFAAFVAISSLLPGQGPDAQRIFGSINPVTGGIQMQALTQQQSTMVDLTVFQAKHPQLVMEIDTAPDADSPGDYLYTVQYGLAMGVDLGADGLVGLQALALTDPFSQRPYVQLSIKPSPAEIITLDQIGNLMGGQSWEALFTGYCANFKPLFQNFGFLSWSATVGFAPTVNLSGTLLQMGTPPSQTYTIVEGYLTLVKMETRWLRIDPFATGGDMVALEAQLALPNDISFFVSIIVGSGSYLNLNGAFLGDITIPLGDWANLLLSGFNAGQLSTEVRDFLNTSLVLDEVSLSLNSDGSRTSFAVNIHGKTTLTATETDFTVNLLLDFSGTAWTLNVKASALVGSATFHGEFISTTSPVANSWSVEMAWENRPNPVRFVDIAWTLGFDLPEIPYQLDLDLVAAGFRYDSSISQFILSAESDNWGKAALISFKSGPKWVFGYSMNIAKATQVGSLINLSNLPLISQVLDASATLGINLKAMVTTDALTSEQVGNINQHLQPEVQFPAQGFAGGFGFSIQMNFGGTIIPVSMAMDDSTPAGQRSTASGTLPAPATGNPVTPVQALPAPVDDGTLWVNVQKTFGPVFFEKVGVAYADSKLWFALNATLRMGSFTANLIGLRVGTPLDTFSPSFDIDGLGLDIKAAGFELGGALLNMRPAQGFQFAGVAVARAMGLSLALAGSYGQVTVNSRTVTTMFLFGQLNGLALGQPYLMVTGVSGGVGYNSSLRLPTAATVNQFPLVANLAQTGQSSQTPMQMIQTLMSGSNPWIRTSAGQFWVAAGVSLSSFGMVKLNALAIASFGNTLELGLIGQATARFPSTGPTAFANIVLNMGATYRQSEGGLSIFAVLGSSSYILDPSVKLTGGFAFSSWFSGPHAGDYAITLGGYHPRYSIPLWYPRVDRLGISWSLGSTVSITGQAYLAMTPAAMMLGGLINLNYSSGSKRAWFNANFDALIQYAPFAFDLNIGITVGASYTAEVWGLSKTFTAELGANLRLWGPPVGGRVVVDWTVVTIEIAFGASNSNSRANKAATWPEFQPLLPAPGKYCAISAESGVTGNYVPPTASGVTQGSIVDGNSLVFTTISAIPLSVAKTKFGTVFTQKAAGSKQSIRPMRVTNQDSVQTLVLSKLVNGAYQEQDLSAWTFSSITRSVPKSLWGTYTTSTALPTPNDQMVSGQLVGLRLSPPAPNRGDVIGPISVANLYAAARSFSWAMPVLAGQTRQGLPLHYSTEAVPTISQDIGSPNAVGARSSTRLLLVALGFDLDPDSSDLANLQADLTDYFDGLPMLAY